MELLTKDQLKQVCGDSEGSRVFSQFAVQKANWKVLKPDKFVKLRHVGRLIVISN